MLKTINMNLVKKDAKDFSLKNRENSKQKDNKRSNKIKNHEKQKDISTKDEKNDVQSSNMESTSDDKLDAKKISIGIIAGAFVGFLSGFFGGGGGMIVVPLLIFGLKLAEKEAHATAIFTILPISIASSIVYIVKGSVNFGQLGFATIGFVIGGALGALLLSKMNNKLI